jgi:DegV family protein with EDD domain
MIEKGCPIEVVDSETASIGLGLINIVAATAAKAGQGLQQVLEEVTQTIHNTHLLGLLDTLKYLLLGGRIGKAKALLGSVLNVKPILATRDGEVIPITQTRTRAKGIERLFDFVKDAVNIQDLAIAYSTTLGEAQTLAQRIGSIFTKAPIRIARLGTTLGVHAGPGALIVALREKTANQYENL